MKKRLVLLLVLFLLLACNGCRKREMQQETTTFVEAESVSETVTEADSEESHETEPIETYYFSEIPIEEMEAYLPSQSVATEPIEKQPESDETSIPTIETMLPESVEPSDHNSDDWGMGETGL